VAHSFSSIDELGEGHGFRKVRAPLGITAFGVNAIVYPPGMEGFLHYHDTQDELYFVHSGTARFEAGGETREVGPGEVLEVGRCVTGLRAYVCVRGGIEVEPTLGSRSTDLLTGLGPAPLRAGDVLEIGADAAQAMSVEAISPREIPEEPLIRIRLGPRDDWFTPSGLETLCAEPWRVSSASNRVGIRLEGPRLERARTDELLSEGLVTGALQVPSSGQPILLLQDHPTTGGYPVIGVVRSDDLWLAGQLAPSQRVRFIVHG